MTAGERYDQVMSELRDCVDVADVMEPLGGDDIEFRVRIYQASWCSEGDLLFITARLQELRELRNLPRHAEIAL